MPITMSNTKDLSKVIATEESFIKSETGFSDKGGEVAHKKFGLFGSETGANVAGVTPEFVDKYKVVLHSYTEDVKTEVHKLTNPPVNNAFRGTAIEQALNKFIEEIKEVAKSYYSALSSVQQQMAQEVYAVYQAQDKDLGEQLGNDTTTLNNSSLKGFYTGDGE